MGDTQLVVVGLEVENVKRIKALKIQPPRIGVVVIGGKNDQGKSSALDAIVYALGGKDSHPVQPVRKGEKAAKIVAVLREGGGGDEKDPRPGDLVVMRRWTEKDTYIDVERVGPNGERLAVKRPQEFLDGIVGAGLGFDPTEFDRMKPADQAELFLRFVPGNPRDLDAQAAALATKRAEVNREVRRLQGALASAPSVEAPDDEVSVADLVRLLEARLAQVSAREEAGRALERAGDVITAKRRRIMSVDDQIADLEAKLAKLREYRTELVAEIAAHEQALKTATANVEAMPTHADEIDALRAQIATADETNARVRAKKARAATADELAAKEAESTAMTATIEELRAQKAKLIAEAPGPVPGLGFEEIGGAYVVTYNGVALSQASASVRMRVNMSIAVALNPKLGIILLREGAMLDEDARAELERFAAERGLQPWLEVVGKGDAKAFIIEDGGVARVPVAG